jgi:glycosyltransferase involved in cell wall biosynthesis
MNQGSISTKACGVLQRGSSGPGYSGIKVSRNPLVSVVINFLNAEQFLQEAIESVLAQTYDNWELLLVDDGSTDASTNIALQYIQEHPRKLHFLEHEGHQNKGSSASRNLGSKKANGEYIAFLDADDIWLPLKLEEQVAILEEHPEAAMVYGKQKVWYSWTGKPEDTQRDFIPNLGVPLNTLIEPPKLVILFLRKGGAGVVPSPSGILMHREAIEHVGGFEESFRNVSDDMVFYAKLCLEMPVFVSDKCWYWYRQHPNQRCYITNQTGQRQAVRLTYLNWLSVYLSRGGVRNREVWPVLQKELWPYRHPNLQRLLTQINTSVVWIARQILPVSVRKWLQFQWQNR